MGKSKKQKLSSSTGNILETMPGSVTSDMPPSMTSSKKKEKHGKGDTSIQSNLNSYISTSNPSRKLMQKKMKQKGIFADTGKSKLSPKKEQRQPPTSESSSDEALEHSISKKRKSNDSLKKKKSKKIKLLNNAVKRNDQSNSLLEKKVNSDDSTFKSPVKISMNQSQQKASNLAPRSSMEKKKKQHHHNYSSDEGMDMGDNDDDDQEEESEENHPGNVDNADGQQPGTNNWSKEEIEELIFRVNCVIKPDDNKSYRMRLKTLSWGDIPNQLHPPRTEDECNQQLQEIVKKIKSMRNLHEILRAYKYKPLKKNVVMNPMRRFMVDHKSELQKLEGNLFANAKAAFAALPEAEQKRYRDAFEAETILKHRGQKSRSKSGRSTFKIFCERLPNSSTKDLKEAFQSQTPEQRLALIKLAFKEFKHVMKSYEAIREQHPETEVKPPYDQIKKEEWKLLLQSKGMPLLPVNSPYQLYQLERSDSSTNGRDGPVAVLQHYNKWARSSYSAQYEQKFMKIMEEFRSKFKPWYETLKQEILKKHAHAYYTEVTTGKGGVKKSKAANLSMKIASKVQELEQSYVESTMVGKFTDEPVPPPMSAKELLRVFVNEKNKKLDKHVPKVDFSTVWSKLDKDNMAKCENSAAQNVTKYKESLKQYVKELPIYERRVYIGQNRVRFIRVFEGTDIFENDYPCSQYPPFKIQSKNDKSPSKERVKNKLDIDIATMLKPASDDRNGLDETNEDESDEMVQNRERTLSEDSFKGRLSSTSTPGTISKKGSVALKEINSKQTDEKDSESSSSDESDDIEDGGHNSTQYLENVQKVHSKKLMQEVYTDSDDSSDSDDDDGEEVVPKHTHPVKTGLSPASILMKSSPGAMAAAAAADTSSSENDTSSSDGGLPITYVTNSPAKASPYSLPLTKKTSQPLSSKMQAASGSKTAAAHSSFLKQSPKAAVKSSSDSSSDSSDSEDESPAKPIAKSAVGRVKPSYLPSKDDSSSEDDDINSAWA